MAGKHWIIVLIIVVMSYLIYNGVQDLKYGKEIWTTESRGIMIDRCMQDSKEMAINYRELTFEYCVCTTDKIQAEFTQREYTKILEKPMEIQEEKLLPSFQSCLTEYQGKIKKEKIKASAQQGL
ncbi:hypothetical protein AREALGSMS7_01981 [Arenibacter algicola]|uniref:Uncharacterized protein n=2 Tax=Arenibacter algicola TaxID=616991 RepID=A0A221UX25_9FLAO|nr:hypothetical protein AREALGSMS7_01978 [Arenibacter algicola]ASO05441.1 hypothetical protein AREALGSMS7_01981 [Arenibacter algicola]